MVQLLIDVYGVDPTAKAKVCCKLYVAILTSTSVHTGNEVLLMSLLIFQLGMQPIHFAAQSGHMNVINALVNEYGVDPNSKVSI